MHLFAAAIVNGWCARGGHVPELPEVETVMRGLMPAMKGRRILRVQQRRPDLRFPLPSRFVGRLEGRRVQGLSRRAKYILADIEGGETLLMHLGMSGRFTVTQAEHRSGDQLGEFVHPAGGDARHDHVVFELEGDTTVTYNDARRFGMMDLIPPASLATHPLLTKLGIEPLGNELSPAFLARVAQGRSTDLKAFLMDQRIIAGLGNIYVCEALHRSGLKPIRKAGVLADARGRPTAASVRLSAAIRDVLIEAIAAGGSTLRDYQHTDGSLGYFQTRFSVYDREGDSCVKSGCDGHIKRMVQAGRSTYYCPHCQR